MKIQRITMRGFMSHTDTVLTFPDNGIVLVTGANGAGKSTIIEAVSYGLWAKTLRGKDPWSSDDGSLEVVTDTVTVRRVRRKGKTSLTFTPSGQTAPTAYETTSKAQEALETVVGSWDVWRRSSVFSSADAAHFSLASDADRKRLLESVLGIDRFDDALKACREDLKACREEAAQIKASLDVAATEHEGLAARLADAVRVVHEGDPGPPPPEEAGLANRACQLEASVSLSKKAIDTLLRRKSEEEFKGASLRIDVAGLVQAIGKKTGVCRACGRAFDAHDVEGMQAALDEARTKLQEVSDASALVIADIDAEIEEETSLRDQITEQLNTVRAAFTNHREASRAYERRCTAYATAQARAADIESMLLKAKEKEKALEQQHADASSRIALLGAVEKVLGTKGVRAHVLGQVLHGLEQVSSLWLSRISGGAMSLKLDPYTEKSTGGVRDAIKLDVHGAGRGQGYQALSGGERRRVDVALVLGLAEIAAGASMADGQGALFADEIFDAVDTEGKALITEALTELAADRTVVVISHSKELIDSMTAAQQWVVDTGTITVHT